MSSKKNKIVVQFFRIVGMLVGCSYGATIAMNSDNVLFMVIIFCGFGVLGGFLGSLIGNVVFRIFLSGLAVFEIMFRQTFMDVFRDFFNALF